MTVVLPFCNVSQALVQLHFNTSGRGSFLKQRIEGQENAGFATLINVVHTGHMLQKLSNMLRAGSAAELIRSTLWPPPLA